MYMSIFVSMVEPTLGVTVSGYDLHLRKHRTETEQNRVFLGFCFVWKP